MSDDGKNRESQWNLNDASFHLIADLQREAIYLMNHQKYNPSLERWIAINKLVESIFSDTEIKMMDRLAEDYFKPIKITFPEKLMESLSDKKIKILKQRLPLTIKKKRLAKYVRELMILMRRYSLYLTEKEKKHKLS